MKIKEGAILAGLDIRMRPALKTADAIWREFGQELVITCGLDGTHSAGSFHYYGLAIDCRTNYFAQGEAEKVAEKLRNRLGVCFDVILHDTHIHIENDPT